MSDQLTEARHWREQAAESDRMMGELYRTVRSLERQNTSLQEANRHITGQLKDLAVDLDLAPEDFDEFINQLRDILKPAVKDKEQHD